MTDKDMLIMGAAALVLFAIAALVVWASSYE
jgi:hypothetical protein